MLDRLLYQLRGIDPVRLLGSWRLSIVLMVLAALYNGILTAFAQRSPAPVVGNIAGLAPFWAAIWPTDSVSGTFGGMCGYPC